MNVEFRKAGQPRRMSKRMVRLCAEAEALGFRPLGWTKVDMGLPLLMCAFVNEECDIILTMNGPGDRKPFDPMSVDFMSYLPKGRTVTTSTFEVLLPQEARGIYKYSHPGVGMAGLLRLHLGHLRKLKAQPVARVRSLPDLQKALREFLAHEWDPASMPEMEEAADEELSPAAERFLAKATAEFNRKQNALRRQARLDEFKQWLLDPKTGVLTLSFKDGAEFQADGQILGTYCATDESWEWAWNNPNVARRLARDSAAAKRLGKKFGLSYMVTGFVPVLTEEMLSYVCAVGLKATGAAGVFRARTEPVEMLLTLKRPRWSKQAGRGKVQKSRPASKRR